MHERLNEARVRELIRLGCRDDRSRCARTRANLHRFLIQVPQVYSPSMVILHSS